MKKFHAGLFFQIKNQRKQLAVESKGILIAMLTITLGMWLVKTLWVAHFLQGLAQSKEHVEHAAHHPVKTDHFFADGDHNKEFDHEAVLGKRFNLIVRNIREQRISLYWLMVMRLSPRVNWI